LNSAGGRNKGGRSLAAPIPPPDLLARIGRQLRGHDDAWLRRTYETSGRARKRGIIEMLPEGYSFDGRRVLDFGCGAGRVLRQFLPEAESAEFWGCDLHQPTIEWLSENLSPPMRFYVDDEMPLPHPDGYFDLVYGISVFTHITVDWSAWLLELHRILKPDGLLLATFMGPATWGRLPVMKGVREDNLGMAVLGLHRAIEDTSGPVVLHSPWWIRSHWGRAFDVVSLKPDGFTRAGHGHGVFLGRKRDVSLTTADLEAADPADKREIDADREYRRILAANAAGLSPARLQRFQEAQAELGIPISRPSRWQALRRRSSRFLRRRRPAQAANGDSEDQGAGAG
jgi:SAM-dependent methyltransferase